MVNVTASQPELLPAEREELVGTILRVSPAMPDERRHRRYLEGLEVAALRERLAVLLSERETRMNSNF